MDKEKMEQLYKILERAEKEHDTETAATLRWAIFSLENQKMKEKHEGYNDEQRLMIAGMDRLIGKFNVYPNEKEFTVEDIIQASNEVYQEILKSD